MRRAAFSLFLVPTIIGGTFLFCETAFRVLHFGIGGLDPFRFSPAPNALAGHVVALDDPILPYRLKANYRGYFKGATLATNEHGWRNPPTSESKPAGTVRLAALGESVTMGAGVTNDETYSAQLQSRLAERFPGRFEVLNFGVGGYRTDQMIEVYERYATKFAPDAVMVPVYYDGYLSLDDRVSGRYAPLQQRAAKWDNLRSYFRESFAYQAVRQAARTQLNRFLAPDWAGRGKTESKPAGQTVADVLEEFLRKHPEMPVYLLALHRVVEPPLERQVILRKRVLEFVARFPNVTLIDTVHGLGGRVMPSDNIYWGDGHPNARVHDLYAREIARQIDLARW